MVEDREKVLAFLMRNYGSYNEELIKYWSKEQNENEETFNEKLRQLGLINIGDRNNLYWRIENLLESTIFKNNNLEYSDLVLDEVVKVWNQNNDIKINKNMVDVIRRDKNFNSNQTQEAFKCLCNGDIDYYNFYESTPLLFADLLLRFFVILHDPDAKGDACKMAEKLLVKYYGQDGKKELDRVMKRRFNYKNYALMAAYQRVLDIDTFVFIPGMIEIVKKYAEENKENGLIEFINNNLSEKESNDEEYENGLIEERDKQDKEKHNNAKEEDVDIYNKKHDRQNSSKIKELLHQIENKIDIMMNESGTVKEELQENRVNEIEQLKQNNLQLEKKVKDLEDKCQGVEQKTIARFIQKLGDKNANYLLSKLYRESENDIPPDRKISIGRLVNMFSLFNVMGIYPYFADKKQGQTFEVSREELIKNYMLEEPISNNENEKITVCLIQNGWKYMGDVIVMPLVKEIKNHEGDE